MKPSLCRALTKAVRRQFFFVILWRIRIGMYRKIGNSARLSHEVADHIMMLIRERQLKPGDKLPSEV